MQQLEKEGEILSVLRNGGVVTLSLGAASSVELTDGYALISTGSKQLTGFVSYVLVRAGLERDAWSIRHRDEVVECISGIAGLHGFPLFIRPNTWNGVGEESEEEEREGGAESASYEG